MPCGTETLVNPLTTTAFLVLLIMKRRWAAVMRRTREPFSAAPFYYTSLYGYQTVNEYSMRASIQSLKRKRHVDTQEREESW